MREALILYLGDDLPKDHGLGLGLGFGFGFGLVPTHTSCWRTVAMLTMAMATPVSQQRPPAETPSCRAPSGRAWIMLITPGELAIQLARITVRASAFVQGYV